MRKLASVQVIDALRPIPEKDRIELAAVLGWQVIVRKGEYSVGDQCVYVEIDSVLPEKPEFEFLRGKNFRIRTMKMAQVISQGICFPLSVLPKKKYAVGQDVTSIMGVKQYEPTMDVERDKSVGKYPKWLMRHKWFRSLVARSTHGAAYRFPSFISKTDETRIQNIPFVLLNKQPLVATEKVDGQSGSFCLVKRNGLFGKRYEYIVCSRNRRLPKKDNSAYWAVSDEYDIEHTLQNMIGDNAWIAIQGECVAPKVQGNKYKVQEADMYVFNVITPNGRMGSVEATAFVTVHGMKFVPIVATDYVLPDTVAEVLEYAHGDSAIGDTLREGIVFRSHDGKLSFKAVDPLFLLKYNE